MIILPQMLDPVLEYGRRSGSSGYALGEEKPSTLSIVASNFDSGDHGVEAVLRSVSVCRSVPHISAEGLGCIPPSHD